LLLFGELISPRTNECFTVRRKLKDIRNNLSHNRIENLVYNDSPLAERSTKEKLLQDYFESGIDNDLSKSDIWNTFSEAEKKEIVETFEKARADGLI